MAIDGLLLILAPLPAVGSGDTAVFDAPSGTFTTVAGSVDTITAAPVSLTTDADWFPFDPDASRTMQVGYNKTSDEYYNGSRIYADRFKASSGWINYTGTTTLDSNGELTGISGNAYIYLWATPYAGDDLGAWPTVPESGTVVLRFNNPGGATDPGCHLSDYSDLGYTFGSRVWTGIPDDDGKYTLKLPYTRPSFVPLSEASTAYLPYVNGTVTLWTTTVITGVTFYIEEETPSTWTLQTDPLTLAVPGAELCHDAASRRDWWQRYQHL